MKYFSLYNILNENKIIQSIKNGLILSIPILLIGSISLIFISMPIDSYQSFLHSSNGAALLNTLDIVNSCSSNILSLILLVTISYTYGESMNIGHMNSIIMSLIAITSYNVVLGDFSANSQLNVFNIYWIPLSVFVAVLSSVLFVKLNRLIKARFRQNISASCINFNTAILAIMPSILIVTFFALLSYVTTSLFQTSSFYVLINTFVNNLFFGMGRNILTALIFIFLMHFFWFFGIHGSNVLDIVAENIFASGLDINIQAVANGIEPNIILTKTFFDVFVMLGGCGSLFCLVFAILIKGKRKGAKNIVKISMLPIIFNINEILLFGVPIVLNPIMFIPFIITPIVLTIISFLALYFGLVPMTITSVEWTTPIFFSGYLATESFNGIILQFINLIIGTCIYIPFVKISDKLTLNDTKVHIDKLVNVVKESEQCGADKVFLHCNDSLKLAIQNMVEDLRDAMASNSLQLYYQPQHDSSGNLLGIEALLRWNHSIGGFIYPPLIIALAKEGNMEDELGLWVINRACEDMAIIESTKKEPIKVSVNISIDQLNDSKFGDKVSSIVAKHKITPSNLGIEFTEQLALKTTPEIEKTISQIRDMGIKILMDDFGMGHSSMCYLQNTKFDFVKLDGSLVKDILNNERSADIIRSIVQLSGPLNFSVIAEYVETKEQAIKLRDLGCNIYQGYLYSPALPFDKLQEYMKS